MNRNLTYDFSVDKAQKRISVGREFAAELPLVWDAYTKKEILDQWWAPHPWKARTKHLDFKEGGTWLYAMVGPQGEEHWAMATYTKIVDQQLFKSKDAFTDKDGNIKPDMPQANWEVNFEAKGDHTHVSFNITFNDLADLEATIQMGFKEGFAIAMEGLDALLATVLK
ncbi:MAG: SRPBCC domain-containing protein [Chitinophaga sp.]|uniref:SRPBCC family protein n=1 Tax=Chitinophaga sp. TaxID=1869181 RepID=UPI0025BBFC50|nr:SRPBCC domain-containing protein [Chitinophaga sp.]MBV8251327.1 SRPBCC domain-containing protein [Chitinophaga sp.]